MSGGGKLREVQRAAIYQQQHRRLVCLRNPEEKDQTTLFTFFSKYGRRQPGFYAPSVIQWYLSNLSISALLIYLMTNYLSDTRKLIAR